MRPQCLRGFGTFWPHLEVLGAQLTGIWANTSDRSPGAAHLASQTPQISYSRSAMVYRRGTTEPGSREIVGGQGVVTLVDFAHDLPVTTRTYIRRTPADANHK